ncbi:hypothetical protein GCM10025868_17950 [Angustibacter aerolatus]|uniref:Uncharacterized protein n=1 Tax=Angustibacter aerolatus TaxID=1162965 RepID=A0ABQ6JI95_9ACTN|nr:hypothetical protein [Angustibacter aerolatus]GMA86545.1 hypothetical protein GCM10025868_17950 [Angustibacter aerolatus]
MVSRICQAAARAARLVAADVATVLSSPRGEPSRGSGAAVEDAEVVAVEPATTAYRLALSSAVAGG